MDSMKRILIPDNHKTLTPASVSGTGIVNFRSVVIWWVHGFVGRALIAFYVLSI